MTLVVTQLFKMNNKIDMIIHMIFSQVHRTKNELLSLLHLLKKFYQNKKGFIETLEAKNKLKKLRAAFGMWANYNNLPDIHKIRSEFDRFKSS